MVAGTNETTLFFPQSPAPFPTTKPRSPPPDPSSMSLHNILHTHIFRARSLPAERRPTFSRPGGDSTGTTNVNPMLVARCIRAADMNNPNPSISFLSSDTALDVLSSLLGDLILPTASPSGEFMTALHSSETHIRRDVSIDESQQYALVSTVYLTLTSILMETGEIFRDGNQPPPASWELSSPPLYGVHGQSDFEVRGVARTGLPCHMGILWEWKREIVLQLLYLQTFWAATSMRGGVVLTLDQAGSPILTFPPGMTAHDHLFKWCNQVGVLLRLRLR